MIDRLFQYSFLTEVTIRISQVLFLNLDVLSKKLKFKCDGQVTSIQFSNRGYDQYITSFFLNLDILSKKLKFLWF